MVVLLVSASIPNPKSVSNRNEFSHFHTFIFHHNVQYLGIALNTIHIYYYYIRLDWHSLTDAHTYESESCVCIVRYVLCAWNECVHFIVVGECAINVRLTWIFMLILSLLVPIRIIMEYGVFLHIYNVVAIYATFNKTNGKHAIHTHKHKHYTHSHLPKRSQIENKNNKLYATHHNGNGHRVTSNEQRATRMII